MSEVSYPETLEQHCKELIIALLERNPNERPQFESLKAQPWFSDIEFNPQYLKQVSMPVWITQHAAIEPSPKVIRRSSTTRYRKPQKDITLSLFIQDICTQTIDIGGKVDAECAAVRWMTSPSPKTLELFQGWDFVSDDAKSMEMNAINQNRQMGLMNHIRSRRATTFI